MGVAYHGNRMLHHVREDMRDIIEHHCDYVLHMFSDNDLVRHHDVMKDIVRVTKEYGLKTWIDSWGQGRVFAGEVSGFCGDFPEARQELSDGTFVGRACLHAPEFRNFIKAWTDAAAATGADAAFWDEPNIAYFDATDKQPARWGCRCQRCRNLFKDMFGGEMPVEMTQEVIDFRHHSVVDFLDFATRYAREKGLENVVCCMIAKDARYGDKNWEDIFSLPAVDNFGTDPYCHNRPGVVLKDYYAEHTKHVVELGEKLGKAHHLWVQAFGITAGREGEIIEAVEACYGAGARNIAAWGYMGSIANDYRCQNPEAAWEATGEAFRRVRWR